MNHLNSLRGTMLVLAQAFVLCACGTSAEAPRQQAAHLQEENAPAQSAQPASAPVPGPTAAATDTGSSGAAMQVFIDPVTGKPREPTAAEIKALATARQAAAPNQAITQGSKQGKVTVLPNGTVAYEETSLSEMKGCVQKDGSITVDHNCKSNVAAPVKKP
jgi:hypothetical protein